MGAVTVLGFVATTYAVAPPDHHARPAPPVASQAAARPSWTESLFGMVRTMLMGIIADALNPKTQQSGQARPTQVDASLS